MKAHELAQCAQHCYCKAPLLGAQFPVPVFMLCSNGPALGQGLEGDQGADMREKQRRDNYLNLKEWAISDFLFTITQTNEAVKADPL